MKSLKEKIKENKEEVHHYVDGILINPDNEILILQRANYLKNFRGQWGFVGGSVDKKDNSNKDAIIREIKEETGIELNDHEKENMKSYEIHEHLGGPNDEEVVSDTEYWIVKLDEKYDIKISKEHQRYKWVDSESFKEKQGKYMSDVYHYIEKIYREMK